MDRWLLLTFQLPSRPSHVRVKTWRRLQQIGALSTRHAVYVLPNIDQCRENFEWVRAEIVALGGDASVFAATSVAPARTDDALVAAFNEPRTAAYARVTKDIGRALSRARRSRLSPAARQDIRRKARSWRERLEQIARIDFFEAPGRNDAFQALTGIDAALLDGTQKEPPKAGAVLERAHFQRRRWVTRPRPGVDRMASAWLIRRYIDPDATFGFDDAPDHADVSFDMFGGTFTHEGALCTFETLAQRFGIRAPAVQRIGQIVHDLDMNDNKYAAVEVPAIGRLIDGLRKLYRDDDTLLARGIEMFEALARSFEPGAATPASERKRARSFARKR